MKIEIYPNPNDLKKFVVDISDFSCRMHVTTDTKLDPTARQIKLIDDISKEMLEILKIKLRKHFGHL